MITFRNLTGGLPYAEKIELQSYVDNYVEENNIKKDSLKEEIPVQTKHSIK